MGKKKILIIDNNESFLETTQDILRNAGYNAVTLSDPFKAEECMKKEKPDLLILDILMHGRSGFNILQDFSDKNIYQEIPKILLTVLDNPVERTVAAIRGVEEYITKPFNPDDLISKIKKCLGETR